MVLVIAIYAVIIFLLFLAAPGEGKGGAHVRVETIYKPPTCDQFTSKNDKITVKYSGSIEGDAGAAAESSPSFEMVLGSEEVMEGWNRGLNHMCVGEKRLLHIPPAFTNTRNGKETDSVVPLLYEIELLHIQSSSHQFGKNVFELIDEDGDGVLSVGEMGKYFRAKHGNKGEMPRSHFDRDDLDEVGVCSFHVFWSSIRIRLSSLSKHLYLK